ncbi:chromosome partitioning protein ParA [Vibrio sp. S4M6]|uniref:chromosome partitioning protein ParA n=1 Tax=Vibrio sinus TaxID=2946865 RepID=UPI00202A9607|nr:chromosome partitioning protein ParA [Vibrio sinus]MCL9781259.1 chromosome partitioning protein ParA [Vibrio sinus]
MNTQNEMDEQDDVVVIEQRDRRSYVYIGLALVIGLAIGGLVGSTITANKWQQTLQKVQTDYQHLQQKTSQLVDSAKNKVADVDKKSAEKMAEALQAQSDKYLSEISKLKTQVTEVEKVNMSLEEQVAAQKQKLEASQKTVSKLDKQADMQATMFEHAKELFQKELKVKQELSALEKEREQLVPKVAALKKECSLYLAGTSWNATSDSCDKQDEANSRLSQIDQLIQVHKLDLKQINELTSQIGLTK